MTLPRTNVRGSPSPSRALPDTVAPDPFAPRMCIGGSASVGPHRWVSIGGDGPRDAISTSMPAAPSSRVWRILQAADASPASPQPQPRSVSGLAGRAWEQVRDDGDEIPSTAGVPRRPRSREAGPPAAEAGLVAAGPRPHRWRGGSTFASLHKSICFCNNGIRWRQGSPEPAAIRSRPPRPAGPTGPDGQPPGRQVRGHARPSAPRPSAPRPFAPRPHHRRFRHPISVPVH